MVLLVLVWAEQVVTYKLRPREGGGFECPAWFQDAKPRLQAKCPLINLPYVIDGTTVAPALGTQSGGMRRERNVSPLLPSLRLLRLCVSMARCKVPLMPVGAPGLGWVPPGRRGVCAVPVYVSAALRWWRSQTPAWPSSGGGWACGALPRPRRRPARRPSARPWTCAT